MPCYHGSTAIAARQRASPSWQEATSLIRDWVLVILLLIGLSAGIPDSSVVPASDIQAKIKAAQPVEFDYCTIIGDLDLSGLKIEQPVHFNHTIFQNSVNFNSSILNGDAHFLHSVFKDNADFKFSTFNSTADFRSSTFNSTANFTSSAFNDYVYFGNSAFNDNIDFGYSDFNQQYGFQVLSL
jgi:hypothetical protein